MRALYDSVRYDSGPTCGTSMRRCLTHHDNNPSSWSKFQTYPCYIVDYACLFMEKLGANLPAGAPKPFARQIVVKLFDARDWYA